MNRSKRLEDLSPEEKRALLANLLRIKATQEDASMAIGPMSVSELRADALLDPAIRPEGPPVESLTDPASIFLTGATGFLGAFLLYELLQRTEADIYCLVRSPSDGRGKERIQRSLESYSFWDARLSSRIFPVTGDLSQTHLGLSAEHFRMLAGQVDLIYHNAASVNLIRPYESLRAPNVLGTQEVLRLASKIKVKPVHYVSTIAVYANGGSVRRELVQESDSINDTEVPYGGYAQSKWVAEKLVATAVSRGVPVCIYRPGWVSGHSQTDIWNSNDLVFRIVEAALRIGKAPDLDTMVDMAPIDYVSRAIVYLSRQNTSAGKVFHLVNPRPVHYGQVIDWVRSSGYPVERMSYENWRAELVDLARRPGGHVLRALLDVVSEWMPGGASRMPQFACQNTLDGLAGTAIVCPPIGRELLHSYLSYFGRRLRK